MGAITQMTKTGPIANPGLSSLFEGFKGPKTDLTASTKPNTAEQASSPVTGTNVAGASSNRSALTSDTSILRALLRGF